MMAGERRAPVGALGPGRRPRGRSSHPVEARARLLLGGEVARGVEARVTNVSERGCFVDSRGSGQTTGARNTLTTCTLIDDEETLTPLALTSRILMGIALPITVVSPTPISLTACYREMGRRPCHFLALARQTTHHYGAMRTESVPVISVPSIVLPSKTACVSFSRNCNASVFTCNTKSKSPNTS